MALDPYTAGLDLGNTYLSNRERAAERRREKAKMGWGDVAKVTVIEHPVASAVGAILLIYFATHTLSAAAQSKQQGQPFHWGNFGQLLSSALTGPLPFPFSPFNLLVPK